MARLQLKRGLKGNLPSSGMLAGEPMVTTDRGTLHVATGAAARLPVVPAIEDLASVGAVDGAADLLILHDASETGGPKEKKISVDALKTALNIPTGSADEKVAAVAGGTSGYLFGTDGTNGVLRMNASMLMTKDAGNGFVTLAVGDVDCGSF